MSLQEALAGPMPGEWRAGLEWLTPEWATGIPSDGWDAFACRMSTGQGGLWFPSEAGCTWALGSRAYRVQEPAYARLVLDCQDVARSLGLEPGYTVGACALALLKYIGPPSYPYKGLIACYGDRYCNYQDVTPGEHEWALKVDVRSCYASLWRRLPSLRPIWEPGRITWGAQDDGEAERRARVDQAVADRKVLRNSLVGCALGATAPRVSYHRGQRKMVKGRMGPFRPAGLLVMRTAYELCRIASHQADSIHTNTDHIVTATGSYPTVWGDVGLVVDDSTEGPAEVCSLVSARVGRWETHYYTRGSRYKLPEAKEAVDDGRPAIWRWLRAG